jgi:DNA-damage-inducible protein J
MAKSAMIRARIEPHLKHDVEEVLRKLGLNPTAAIGLFYRQIMLRRGLPFEIALPNSATRKTLADTDAGRNLVRCKDADEMFRNLDI